MELLPEANVYGGDLTGQLPRREDISEAEAVNTLDNVRDKAVDLIHNEISDEIDCENLSSMMNKNQGYRTWPDGYTGSFTHKGALTLCAVVSETFTKSVGIDIEFDQKEENKLNHVVNNSEVPEQTDKKPAILGIFSTKESVYKAYYPIKKREIGFDDVSIDWLDTSPMFDYGTASCSDSTKFQVKCRYIGRWVVSTAQILNKTSEKSLNYCRSS